MRDWSEQLCLVVDIEPGQLRELSNSRESLAELEVVGGEHTGDGLDRGVAAHSLGAEHRRHPVSDQSRTSSSWQRLPD